MEIKKLLGKIKFKELVYPAITVSFFAIVIISFVLDIGFITQNINKVFYVPDSSEIESRMVRVDMENFYVVARKLGINVSAPSQQQEVVQPVVPQEQQPQPVEPVAPVVPVVEKAILKISVLNTTTTKGLAAIVKKDLETAGFTVAETGNQTPALEATQIKVKSAVNGSDTIKELAQVVTTKYPSATVVADDTIAVDVVVLIGAK